MTRPPRMRQRWTSGARETVYGAFGAIAATFYDVITPHETVPSNGGLPFLSAWDIYSLMIL